MQRSPALALLLAVLISACSLPVNGLPAEDLHPTDTSTEPVSPTVFSEQRCGDQVCDGPETSANCSQDCAGDTDPSTENSEDSDLLWVTNPSSGAKLNVQVVTPAGWDGTPLPTLVLVPGGFGSSADFLGSRRSAQTIADQGFTIIIFDPDGRGSSEGEEDKNGHTQQDGLAEIIRTAAGLPEVDSTRIGLVSYSFGVSMASGALARYPDLPIVFYIDWEGPGSRAYTTHDCSADTPGIGSTVIMAPCEDDAFWSEREGETFITQVQVPYLRMQFENDHAQEIVTHAVDMVNAAITGSAPWVRLNHQDPNQTYDPSSPPRMLPGSGSNKLDRLVAKFAAELFDLFAP